MFFLLIGIFDYYKLMIIYYFLQFNILCIHVSYIYCNILLYFDFYKFLTEKI